MLVCPLCRIALGTHDAACPRDGNLGQEASWNAVPAALEKRFTLIAPFCHGPTGSSYLADEPETGRRGLLKIMAPAERTQAAERQRMRRELLKQATMTATHLALPFATGETDGTLWLFRESVEGLGLSAQLASAGPLPQAEALEVAAQLASALDELHRAGLLHRDVKPGHVILARDEAGATRAVLIDSGVCRPLEAVGTGAVFGTPGYVAPEQLAGKLVSFRSDLYALGCVLYEMLTARPPFARADVASTLDAQRKGELPEFPAALSPQVAALVRSLLSKDPQDRPFSAQKLRRALDPFLPHGATVNRHPIASLAKPPAPPVGSRIPSPPNLNAPRPTGRTSVPPPPPARRSNPDATQQVQLDQIVEMAPSLKAPSVAPPPPSARRSAESEAARTRDATEPVELDHVLEVSHTSDQTVVEESPAPAPYRPSADHTQPIRLDQILAVAAQQKKTLSVPPPASVQPAEPVAPVAPAAPVEVAQAPSATVEDTQVVAAADEPPPSIELEIPDETPPSAFLGRPGDSIPTVGDAELEQLDAASASILSVVDEGSMAVYDEAAEEEPGTDNSVTVVAERPSPDARGAHATLVGMPRLVAPPEAGTVARGSEGPPPQLAVDTPRRGGQHLAGDSAQLTLPRDPAAAIAEAQRMDTGRQRPEHGRKLGAAPERSRTVAYVAAAVVLLGLAGVAISRFAGSDEPAEAKEDTASAPVAAASQREPSPAVMPLAAAPKAEPTPTVTAMAAPAAPAAAPSEAAAPAPAAAEAAPARAAAPQPSEREVARSERRARRERSSDRKEPSADKEELWAQARDEARAHYAAKRYKQAAQSYEKATKYNPSNAGTYAGLGGARLNMGDTRGAIQAYQRAAQLSPSTSGFHAALGRAYLTAGDNSKARAAYKRALALDPSNEAAKAALASL